MTSNVSFREYVPSVRDILFRLSDGEPMSFRLGHWRDEDGHAIPGSVIYHLFANGFAEFGPKRSLQLTAAGRDVLREWTVGR